MFKKSKSFTPVVKRDFASITAPLSQMVSDLESYVDDQIRNEEELVAKKAELDIKIGTAKEEQQKAIVTAGNLKAFMDPTRVLMTKAAE